MDYGKRSLNIGFKFARFWFIGLFAHCGVVKSFAVVIYIAQFSNELRVDLFSGFLFRCYTHSSTCTLKSFDFIRKECQKGTDVSSVVQS